MSAVPEHERTDKMIVNGNRSEQSDPTVNLFAVGLFIFRFTPKSSSAP